MTFPIVRIIQPPPDDSTITEQFAGRDPRKVVELLQPWHQVRKVAVCQQIGRVNPRWLAGYINFI